MKIAVLGTGMVGSTMAVGLQRTGHHVVLGTRDPAATRARTEPDRTGFKLADWLAANPSVALETFADAAASAELLVNASSGLASIDVLNLAGAGNLDGKVLVDIANPLDFSGGFPPVVQASSKDSLAERIQAAFPGVRVVKALNTMSAPLMIDPGSLAAGDHTTFVAGNDADAKATVGELLTQLGWQDIVDLGDLSHARSLELMLPVWLSLVSALGVPGNGLQFKIVR